MAKIYPEKALSRLGTAMAYSRETLRPFLDRRLEIVRQRVGHNYGDSGSKSSTPINLLDLAYVTYGSQLVGQTPQASVVPHTAGYDRLKGTAMLLQIALNNLLKEIHYADALATCTMNALDSLGVMKIGLTGVEGDSRIDGIEYQSGRPDCASVDPDDWVHDMSAKDLRGCMFMGNRYSMTMADVMKSDLYSSRAKSLLRTRADTTRATDRYDDFGRERITTLSGDYAYDDELVEPTVELWDIFIPRDKVLLTVHADSMAAGDAMLTPIRAIEWKGPDEGPYTVLAFNRVPNNTMPLPPMLHLLDLHRLANSIFNKLGSQATRQKSVAVTQKGSEPSAKIVRDADDGDLLALDMPEAVREVRYGGIDPNTNLFLLQLKDLFSYFGGNIDTMAGLSPQAETLGQERLIQGSASKRIASMQSRVIEFASKNMKALAYWLFTDPDIDLPMHKPSPGGTVSIPIRLTQKRILGEFLDYNFAISPHSLQYLTPTERLQVITSVWTQFVVPMAPMVAQLGGRINLPDLLKTIAEETNVSAIANLVEMGQSPNTTVVGEDGGITREQFRASKSPVTTRNTVRRNVGSAKSADAPLREAMSRQAAKGSNN